MFPLCMPTVTNSGSSPLNRFGHVVGPMVNSVVPSGLDIGVSGIRHEFSLICSREPRIRLYRFSTLQAGIEGVTRFRSGERRVTLRTERRVGNQNEIRLVLSNVPSEHSALRRRFDQPALFEGIPCLIEVVPHFGTLRRHL